MELLKGNISETGFEIKKESCRNINSNSTNICFLYPLVFDQNTLIFCTFVKFIFMNYIKFRPFNNRAQVS